jgi:hypothetical protein
MALAATAEPTIQVELGPRVGRELIDKALQHHWCAHELEYVRAWAAEDYPPFRELMAEVLELETFLVEQLAWDRGGPAAPATITVNEDWLREELAILLEDASLIVKGEWCGVSKAEGATLVAELVATFEQIGWPVEEEAAEAAAEVTA